MGHKRKLVATARCQGQGVHTESVVDRFSNLPDGVAHYILSFLNITDLTRFGCVSKRCSELHLSTPSLNFDEFSRANVSTFEKRLRLFSCLDRFLTRRGDDKIQCFRICWNYLSKGSEHEKSRILAWVHNAVKGNVEVLDLEFCLYEEMTQFLSSLLLCRSLRSLSVDMKLMFLDSPSVTPFSNLKCLKLSKVRILGERFSTWISHSCKCIKEIVLDKVDGIKNITIESSCLESFSFVHRLLLDPCHFSISADKLADLVIDWGFMSQRKLLNIVAPNLKYIKWTGNLLSHQNLGDLMCLEKAELFLEPKTDEFNILFEVLCSIRRAEVLILKEETIKALFKECSMRSPLDNVSHLRVNIGSLLDDLVPAMVSLFRGMPNLSSLYISSKQFFFHPRTKLSGYDVAYWKMQDLAFIYHLKEVTIELSNGSNGIELAMYILEHAQNLKKLVIVHSPQQSSVKRKLNKSKRISSATVVFQEDQQRGNGKQRLR